MSPFSPTLCTWRGTNFPYYQNTLDIQMCPNEEPSISSEEYLSLWFGKASSLEVVVAVQQFMGMPQGLAAAFIFSHSGSLFPLSHLLIVMDLFSVVYSFQRYWVMFFFQDSWKQRFIVLMKFVLNICQNLHCCTILMAQF